MGGADVRQYGAVRRVMDRIGLQDVWTWDVLGNNPSDGNTCRYTDGDSGGWEILFEASSSPRGANVCRGQDYCDDRQLHPPPHEGVGRFDFVFVSRPTRAQTYTLEVSRPLRRPFSLGGAVLEGERYLSDHIGIELELMCRRR